MPMITVIIPTYHRPQDLTRCLEALKRQTRPANEVLVVVRDSDSDTWALLKGFGTDSLPLGTVTVSVSGVVAAMNAGLSVAKGDIITFTDDDAVPHADWLAQIETHFLLDEHVGGVGGRDWVYQGRQREDGTREVVGIVQWVGRAVGNHHLGTGQAREVDVLKGVNMSYRRTAIRGLRFDQRMRGTGAQVHFEMAFCLGLRQAGWKLIYDPRVAVDHYPGQRFDEDQRNKLNNTALSNAVHNETLALLEYLPPIRRAVFLGWAVLVGTRDAFGFLQWLRFLPREGRLAGQKWLVALQGRWQGWCTWQQSDRLRRTSKTLASTPSLAVDFHTQSSHQDPP